MDFAYFNDAADMVDFIYLEEPAILYSVHAFPVIVTMQNIKESFAKS